MVLGGVTAVAAATPILLESFVKGWRSWLFTKGDSMGLVKGIETFPTWFSNANIGIQISVIAGAALAGLAVLAMVGYALKEAFYGSKKISQKVVDQEKAVNQEKEKLNNKAVDLKVKKGNQKKESESIKQKLGQVKEESAILKQKQANLKGSRDELTKKIEKRALNDKNKQEAIKNFQDDYISKINSKLEDKDLNGFKEKMVTEFNSLLGKYKIKNKGTQNKILDKIIKETKDADYDFARQKQKLVKLLNKELELKLEYKIPDELYIAKIAEGVKGSFAEQIHENQENGYGIIADNILNDLNDMFENENINNKVRKEEIVKKIFDIVGQDSKKDDLITAFNERKKEFKPKEEGQINHIADIKNLEITEQKTKG